MTNFIPHEFEHYMNGFNSNLSYYLTLPPPLWPSQGPAGESQTQTTPWGGGMGWGVGPRRDHGSRTIPWGVWWAMRDGPEPGQGVGPYHGGGVWGGWDRAGWVRMCIGSRAGLGGPYRAGAWDRFPAHVFLRYLRYFIAPRIPPSRVQ